MVNSESSDAIAEPQAPIEVPPDERRLGPYELLYEVASGGMATVFLARAAGPLSIERFVALKRIHPHLAKDPRFTHLLRDEARIASLISHPNVCKIFDFGEHEGRPYIAMEFLVGETLAEVMRRLRDRPDLADDRRMPLYVAKVIADACEGLHAAHELRDEDGNLLHVVHRDVSPQNLFINYDGSVRVVDFGVAKAAGRLQDTTKTGALKGKLAYLAPEQVKHREIDRRTDVWAIGVVAWEFLTTRRLFRRDSPVDTILAVAQDAIHPPSRYRPTVPRELDDIILRSLKRDPRARPATARDLASELQRFVHTHGKPIGMPEVAEWMQALFDDREAERRALLARATDPRIRVLGGTLSKPRPDEAHAAADVQDDTGVRERHPDARLAETLEAKITSDGGDRFEVAISTPAPSTPLDPPAGSMVVPPPWAIPASSSGEPFTSERSNSSLDVHSSTQSIIDWSAKSRVRGLMVGLAVLLIGAVGGALLVLSSEAADPTGLEPDRPTTTALPPSISEQPEKAKSPAAKEPSMVFELSETETPASKAGSSLASVEDVDHVDDTDDSEFHTLLESLRSEEEPESSARSVSRRRRRSRPSQRSAPANESRTPAARAAETAAPVTGSGQVTVIALGGWADIFVGRRHLGRTPRELTLPAGRHVLTLRPGGTGKPETRPVVVEPGKVERVIIHLR